MEFEELEKKKKKEMILFRRRGWGKRGCEEAKGVAVWL